MPDMKEMQDAFMRAHEAGDTAAAAALAGGIKAERARSLAVSKAASDKIDASVAKLPTEGMGEAEKTWAALQGGVVDKVVGTAQSVADLLPKAIPGVEGERESLNKLAGERKKLNTKLYNSSPWAAGGELVGNALPELAPIAKATKAVDAATKLLPKIPFLTKGAQIAASGATGGAISGATTPDEDHDIWKMAGKGSLWGMGGEFGGRVGGRVLKPMREVLKKTASEQLDILKPKVKGLIAEHLSDNPWIRSMTNALGQLPGTQGAVSRARDTVDDAVTKEITGYTGTPTKELAPSAIDELKHNEDIGYAGFRNQPEPVPIIGSDDLKAALVKNMAAAEISGGSGAAAKRLEKQIEAAGGDMAHASGSYTPVGAVTTTTKTDPTKKFRAVPVDEPNVAVTRVKPVTVGTPQTMGKDVVGAKPGEELVGEYTQLGKTRPAKSLMKIKEEGAFTPVTADTIPGVETKTTKMQATGPVKDLPYTDAESAIQARRTLSSMRDGADAGSTEWHAFNAQIDAIDEGLAKAWGPKRFSEFQDLQRQHGVMKDILSTTPAGAPHVNTQSLAQRLMGHGEGFGKPGDPLRPLRQFTAAAAGRIKPPPGTENRAAMAGLILSGLGAAGGGGYVANKITDDPVGTVVGGASIPALAIALLTKPGGSRYLTGQVTSKAAKKLQSDEARELVRLLSTVGTTEAGTH